MAREAGELITQANAKARFVRISPYKVREVCALIKGKQIDEARRVLAFTPKAASHEVSKVLESAVANAEHNFQIPQEELFVRNAWADEGLTIKRGRARAQGRYYRIRKRTSHINLVLERLPEAEAQSRTPRRRRRQEGAEAQTRTPRRRPRQERPEAEPKEKTSRRKKSADEEKEGE